MENCSQGKSLQSKGKKSKEKSDQSKIKRSKGKIAVQAETLKSKGNIKI